MKTFLKDLQRWIVMWLGIIFILWISWISYAVWNWLNAEAWDTLEIWKWNELVNKVKWIYTDSNWNVWVWVVSPEVPLHIKSWNWISSTSPWLWSIQIWDYSWLHLAIDNNEIQVSDNGVAADLYFQDNWWNVWIWTNAPNSTLDVNWEIKGNSFDIWLEKVNNTCTNTDVSTWCMAYCPAWKYIIWWSCYVWVSNAYLRHNTANSTTSWRCKANIVTTVYASAICANVKPW